MSYQLERLQHLHGKRAEKNDKLRQRKGDLESQYQALYEENKRELDNKEAELAALQAENERIQQETASIVTRSTQEMEEAETRIRKLTQIADRALEETHQQKELTLKYTRSVRYSQLSTLSHLEVDLENMKAQSDKQKKKLEILVNLLEASKQHLTNSIHQKTELLSQTNKAASQINQICQETLAEEQAFYEKEEYDKMHTPPYILVKRRERKQ